MPAEFRGIEPGYLGIHPAALCDRFVHAVFVAAEHEGAWPFADLIQSRGQPGPRIEGLGEHHGSAAKDRQSRPERRIHFLHGRW